VQRGRGIGDRGGVKLSEIKGEGEIWVGGRKEEGGKGAGIEM